MPKSIASFTFTVIIIYCCIVLSNSKKVYEAEDEKVCSKISTYTADVIVVGAGYAGLTAARRLSKLNYSVIILEASNATGGRTKNYCCKARKYNVESDYVVELGGQWIGNKTVQSHAWNLIVEELNFEVFNGTYTPSNLNQQLNPIIEEKDEDMERFSILFATNGIHNFTSLLNAFHKLPKEVQKELKVAWDEMNSLSKTINLETPYLHPQARYWDSTTFTTWINATVQLPEARTALNVLCTTMIAQSPDVVSFLHILFYVQAANGMENLVVNEQQYRIRGGSQAPTFKMTKELVENDHGQIFLNAPVKRIVYDNNRRADEEDYPVLVEATTTNDGDNNLIRVKGNYVIITGAPPTTGRGINYEPPLPFEKNQLFQRMPMGNSVKAQIIYDKPFWKDLGYTGTILASTPPFGNVKKPLLSNCFDNSPYSKTFGVLLCFVEGETSIEVMRLTHEERLELILKWLSRSFGKEAMDQNRIINFLDFNWAAQEYIGGAYASFMTTGAWTQYGKNLRSSVNNQLFWAGADYAEDGFGYINGAIQSAGEVVKRIVQLQSRGSTVN